MNTCTQCGNPLGRRQKRFCSIACSNKWNGQRKAERNINDGEWIPCPTCLATKPKNAFSFVDKGDYTKGRRPVCKRCSANSREAERRNRNWKHKAGLVMLNGSKQRAKRVGMEHTLTLSDISIPDICPVFGTPLVRESRESWNSAPSIDRIDSTRGYTPDNIIIVSRRANILKKDATIEELEALATFYARYK
jgi:hypothetical protein